jgi:hypothetical protein
LRAQTRHNSTTIRLRRQNRGFARAIAHTPRRSYRAGDGSSPTRKTGAQSRRAKPFTAPPPVVPSFGARNSSATLGGTVSRQRVTTNIYTTCNVANYRVSPVRCGSPRANMPHWWLCKVVACFVPGSRPQTRAAVGVTTTPALQAVAR